MISWLVGWRWLLDRQCSTQKLPDADHVARVPMHALAIALLLSLQDRRACVQHHLYSMRYSWHPRTYCSSAQFKMFACLIDTLLLGILYDFILLLHRVRCSDFLCWWRSVLGRTGFSCWRSFNNWYLSWPSYWPLCFGYTKGFRDRDWLEKTQNIWISWLKEELLDWRLFHGTEEEWLQNLRWLLSVLYTSGANIWLADF